MNLDLQVTNTTKLSLDFSGRMEQRTAPTSSISNIFEHTTRNPPTIPAYYPGVGYAQVGSYVNTLRSVDPAAGYNKPENNSILTTFQLRRTKESMLDGKKLIELPEKKIDITALHFSEEEADIYKMVRLSLPLAGNTR